MDTDPRPNPPLDATVNPKAPRSKTGGNRDRRGSRPRIKVSSSVRMETGRYKPHTPKRPSKYDPQTGKDTGKRSFIDKARSLFRVQGGA